MIADRFSRIGDNLSADFGNTVHAPDAGGEALHSAKDVLDFLVVAGALPAADATRVKRALDEPAATERFFQRALTLRDAVRRALEAIEHRHALDDDALAVLNATLEADAGFDQITHRRGARYDLTYRRIAADPVSALAPIARDTARLLSTGDAPVRLCAGAGCVRYFYDTSRTGRRRWCDMAICGNRAKAAAFAERRRSSQS